MKTKNLIFALLLTTFVGVCGFGNVSGSKVERFGDKFDPQYYESWITGNRGLITPEFSNFATQSCLRSTQESLDYAAYGTVKILLGEMKQAFKGSQDETKTYALAFASLTKVMAAIDGIHAKNAEDYQKQCQTQMTLTFAKKEMAASLLPLYWGRFYPTLSAALPPALKEKIIAMQKKGLQIVPLTWDRLVEQVCVLEGYYSTSHQPELWKFFSTTRLMGNVLPKESENADFIGAVVRYPNVVKALSELDQYSSVAGKFNGSSMGMSPETQALAEVRLTGSALGSKATSFLAFFTTGWREAIQAAVINQDNPEKPFELVSAKNILAYTANTSKDVLRLPHASQTELGMSLLWEFIANPTNHLEISDYGPRTQEIREAYSMAWLALNAETNIRQNEKIAGYEKTSIAIKNVSLPLFGTRAQYAKLAAQIASAKQAYAAIHYDPQSIPVCLDKLELIYSRAANLLEAKSAVVKLPAVDLDFLADLDTQPVIADIGTEVNDELGDKPEGLFKLHLATGFGRVTEAEVLGQKYEVWVPSSFVLHLDHIATTASWRNGELAKYESPAVP